MTPITPDDLRAELRSSEPSDASAVDDLTSTIFRRADGVRRRRRVAAVAGLAASALIVGSVALNLPRHTHVAVPATSPSVSTTSTPAPTSTPTADPTAKKTRLAPGVIPSGAALKASDMPVKMIQSLDNDGGTAGAATVMGQGCGGDSVPGQTAAHSWGWTEENSNNLNQTWLYQVVTRWEDGDLAFTQIVNNTGMCRFSSDATPLVSEADLYVIEASRNGVPVVAVVRRSGDTIVAVTVNGPQGSKVAATRSLAEDLTRVALDRALASGLGI